MKLLILIINHVRKVICFWTRALPSLQPVAEWNDAPFIRASGSIRVIESAENWIAGQSISVPFAGKENRPPLA